MVRRILAFAISVALFSLLNFPYVNATSSNLLITQVQAGANSTLTGASLMEYISIYNNSSQDVEISNWCLINKSNVKFACFQPADNSTHIWVSPNSYSTIASVKFTENFGVTTDLIYTPNNNISGSIVASSDSISLVDSSNTEIDNVSWGTSLVGGHILQRKLSPDPKIYIDNDLNSDFSNLTSLTVQNSGLYEQQILIDICKNIDGIQLVMPSGYELDNNSDCQPDICLNLIGLQLQLPTDMYIDSTNNCTKIDLCLNLDDFQTAIPVNYFQDEFNNCYVIASQLIINEIFPNVIGSDVGNEFVEIYNPTDTPVDLSFYRIAIGIDSPKYYNFPIGSLVQPKSYYVLYNSNLNFTLLNTSSKVNIETIDGQLVHSTSIYLNPKEGESWNLIGNNWEYSNQPTPGIENLESVIIDTEVNQPKCAENQYLNPDTNRCRLITTKISKLTPCRDGEYRSEETNRCRAILGATTTLAECPEGQYRNPDTNRCKKNIEINRVDYPNNATLNIESTNTGRTVLTSVLAITIGYGVWEWRFELDSMFKKLKKSFKNK